MTALTSEQYQLPPSSVAPDAQRSARATVKVAARTMPEAMNRIMVFVVHGVKECRSVKKVHSSSTTDKRVKGKQGGICVARAVVIVVSLGWMQTYKE